MVTDDKNYFVAVLPVNHQLEFEKLRLLLVVKPDVWQTRKMLNA